MVVPVLGIYKLGIPGNGLTVQILGLTINHPLAVYHINNLEFLVLKVMPIWLWTQKMVPYPAMSSLRTVMLVRL